MKVQEGKFIIAAHVLWYATAHALKDYLLTKKPNVVVFLQLPFVTRNRLNVDVYQKQKHVIDKEFKRHSYPEIINYVLDFLQVLRWSLVQPGRHYIFIGEDPLNCMAGIFLKIITKIDKVIFYSIDFSPTRFANPQLNYIYHSLEKICVIFADETWNVSPKIAEGRQQFLNLSPTKHPQKVVPVGIWPNEIVLNPIGENTIRKYHLIFMGHLLEKQGVQMVLEAVPLIIKIIPNFIFAIIGEGPYAKQLHQQTKHLKVSQHVIFTGSIPGHDELNRMMDHGLCAVALYKPEPDKKLNFTYYADPGKIKEYLARGLPVITTNVPYNAHEITRRQCGLVVNYNKEEVSHAIISLLRNKQTLAEYSKNALSFAREFTWDNVYTNAFAESYGQH